MNAAAAAAAVATPVVAAVLLAVVRYVLRRQAHRERVEAVTRPPAKPIAARYRSRTDRSGS